MKPMSMSYNFRYLCPLLSLFVACSFTMADYIEVSGSGESFILEAGQLDILYGNDHQFSMSELDLLAATLQNDGVDTAGRISFLLTETNAGLSFVGLFDGVPFNDPSGSISDHFLGLSSTTTTGSDWYATGDNGTQTDWYDLGNDTQLINSLFAWDHGQTSAAFAWANVEESQNATVNLYDVDLTTFGAEPIQFVTYADEGWEVAGTGAFSVMGQYAFSYQFVPAPGALALIALAGFTTRKRRRR